MTEEDDVLRMDRDETLYRNLASAATMLLHGFEEWIQGEINDLLLKAEVLEPLQQGEIKHLLKSCGDELKDLNINKLSAAKQSLKNRITEVGTIQDGANLLFDDFPKAQEAIQESVAKFETMVKTLLRTRDFILTYWSPGESDDPA